MDNGLFWIDQIDAFGNLKAKFNKKFFNQIQGFTNEETQQRRMLESHLNDD